MEEEKEEKNHKTLKERIESLEGKKGNGKKRKFFIPFKAKVGNKSMRDGYVSVVVVEDNHNIDFRKEKIIDGTIKLDDSFHAIKSKNIFFYKGKPFIFQPKRKQNPYNPLAGKHETYGDKYILARMEGDKIVGKKRSIGWGVGIGGLVILGIIAYSFISGA